MVVACGAAWLLPVAMAIGRALADGWFPVGDQALIAIRARDVLTEHHPFLGTAASVTFGSTDLTNHPGPLLFDVAALPVRLFGSGAGLVVAIGMVNLGAGLLAITAAARTGGRVAALLTTGGLCALVWSAGNQVLIDPYNPTVSMIPFFSVLVLAWSVIDGDRLAVPALVVIGSFCAQTNLAYVITTVPAVVGALAIHVVRRRHRRPAGDLIRLALVPGLVVWSQPIIEQLAHGRDGNMARLLRSAGRVEPGLGAADGTRRAASVLSLWPGWGRGHFDGYGTLDIGPSLVGSVVSLLVLLAVLIGLGILVRRRLDDRTTATLSFAAAAIVALGWLAAIRVPLSPIYGFNADYVRWLWPIGVVVGVAVLLACWRLLAAVARPRIPLAVGAGLVLVAAVVAALPDGRSNAGARQLDRARPTAEKLRWATIPQLPAGGVTFDPRPPDYPVFGFGLLAAMQEAGIDFFVDDAIGLRQFGADRATPSANRPPILTVDVGFEAVDAVDPLACASTLDSTELGELDADRDALVAALARPGFELTDAGQRYATSPFAPPWLGDAPVGLDDAADVVVSAQFESMLDVGLLVPPAGLSSTTERFLERRRGVEDTTACVVLTAP